MQESHQNNPFSSSKTNLQLHSTFSTQDKKQAQASPSEPQSVELANRRVPARIAAGFNCSIFEVLPLTLHRATPQTFPSSRVQAFLYARADRLQLRVSTPSQFLTLVSECPEQGPTRPVLSTPLESDPTVIKSVPSYASNDLRSIIERVRSPHARKIEIRRVL